jgi:hypothetical protein
MIVSPLVLDKNVPLKRPCVGRKLPRLHGRVFLLLPPPASTTACQRRLPDGSGRHQQHIIRGASLSVEQNRKHKENCPQVGRARRCPDPALRPKRSALRAPQGCAPGQNNKTGEYCWSTEMGIVLPKAS